MGGLTPRQLSRYLHRNWPQFATSSFQNGCEYSYLNFGHHDLCARNIFVATRILHGTTMTDRVSLNPLLSNKRIHIIVLCDSHWLHQVSAKSVGLAYIRNLELYQGSFRKTSSWSHRTLDSQGLTFPWMNTGHVCYAKCWSSGPNPHLSTLSDLTAH